MNAKKLFALLLALAMVFSLVACGSSSSSSSSTSSDDAAAADDAEAVEEDADEAEADEAEAVEEDVVVDDTVYTLIASTHVPGGGTAGTVFAAVLDEITERSNGRIQFELYTDGTLSDAAGILDALESGLADVGMINYSRLNGRMDLVGVCSLPGLFTNAWEAMEAMIELIDTNEAMQAMFADCGVKVMGVQIGTQSVVMSTTEITDITDLSGMTVVTGSTAITGILQTAGANPVSFSNSETYEVVSKGTADALASNSLSGYLGFGIEEVCKYMYNIPLGAGPMLYVISESAYNSLPEDLQAIIDEVYHDFTTDIIYTDYVLELGSDSSYEDTFVAAGGTIIEPTDEQLEEFQNTYCASSYTDWVETAESTGFADAQSVLDDYVALLAEYAGTCPDFE